MDNNIFTSAVIVAAGKGNRMKEKMAKQYLPLCGHPVLYYTIRAFEKSKTDEIVLVVPEEDISFVENEFVKKYGFDKVIAVIAGGSNRAESVFEGIKCVKKHRMENSWESNEDEGEKHLCLIHDGARPLIEEFKIDEMISEIDKKGACVMGVPSKDTMHILDENGHIVSTPERNKLWAAQTPQGFLFEEINEAYLKLDDLSKATDDVFVYRETMKKEVSFFEGNYENIKITTPEDLTFAEVILKKRGRG